MRWNALLTSAPLKTALFRTALAGLLVLPLSLVASSPASAASPISLTSGFYSNPDSGPAAWVRNNPSDSRAARIQSSIASQAIARWYTGGESGGIGPAVANYVGAADSRDKLPVLVAYNIPLRDACGGHSSGGAGSVAEYRTWISTFAAAVGTRPAVVVIEPEALSDFSCLSSAQVSDRLAMLAYASQMFQQKAPNTWAYLDAGHTNWVAPATMASRLNSAGVGNIRGFAVNVSNFYSTGSSETYGNSINSSLGGGSTSPWTPAATATAPTVSGATRQGANSVPPRGWAGARTCCCGSRHRATPTGRAASRRRSPPDSSAPRSPSGSSTAPDRGLGA